MLPANIWRQPWWSPREVSLSMCFLQVHFCRRATVSPGGVTSAAELWPCMVFQLNLSHRFRSTTLFLLLNWYKDVLSWVFSTSWASNHRYYQHFKLGCPVWWCPTRLDLSYIACVLLRMCWRKHVSLQMKSLDVWPLRKEVIHFQGYCRGSLHLVDGFAICVPNIHYQCARGRCLTRRTASPHPFLWPFCWLLQNIF